jgi:hypothetical protein
VFQNRILRRIFGRKRDEAIKKWREGPNEELHNLYFSTNILRMMKPDTIKLAEHIASMEHVCTEVSCYDN